jgi:hypothetical protein
MCYKNQEKFLKQEVGIKQELISCCALTCSNIKDNWEIEREEMSMEPTPALPIWGGGGMMAVMIVYSKSVRD